MPVFELRGSWLNNFLRNESIISSFFDLFSNFFVSSRLIFLVASSNLSNLSCFFLASPLDHTSFILKTNGKNSLLIVLHSFSV